MHFSDKSTKFGTEVEDNLLNIRPIWATPLLVGSAPLSYIINNFNIGWVVKLCILAIKAPIWHWGREWPFKQMIGPHPFTGFRPFISWLLFLHYMSCKIVYFSDKDTKFSTSVEDDLSNRFGYQAKIIEPHPFNMLCLFIPALRLAAAN